MNSIRSLGGERGSRFGFLFALTLAAGLLGMSLMAGSASAGSVLCGGKIKPAEDALSENALTYRITCSEDIQGYSVITNREIDHFGSEVIVYKGTEVAEGDSFACEGSIPGFGTGCYGKMAGGNVVEGIISTTDELCEASSQPKFWVTVLTNQLNSKGVAYNLVSEPFPIPYHCGTLNAKKKAADKAVKLCAKVKLAKSPKSRAAAKKRCQDAIKASKKLHQA